MATVMYDPDEIFEVFQDEKDELVKQEEFIEVANSACFSIYLSCLKTSSGQIKGVMTVESDGYTIEEDFFENEKECVDIFEKAYLNYIFVDDVEIIESAIGDSAYSDGKLDTFYLDEIEQREWDLDIAVVNFIEEISDTGTSCDLTDKNIEEIKDHFLEYLYRRFHIDIYRPMEIVMPDGTEVYEDYPYSKLQFDDSRNIYKDSSSVL